MTSYDSVSSTSGDVTHFPSSGTTKVTSDNDHNVISTGSTQVTSSSVPGVTITTPYTQTTYPFDHNSTEEALLTCDAEDKSTVFGDNVCWSRASAAGNCDYAKRAFESELKLFTTYMGPTDVSRRFIIIFAPPECVSELQENSGNTTSRRIVRIILPEGCESEKDKYNIAVAIYKELSLQWFDKLLTPESLENNGWLWRGLHTYFQHFVTNEINKPWAPEDLMIVRDLQSIAFPQELSVSAQSLSQSQGPFQKAQCIVRMIWHLMSSTEMLNGLWKFAQDAGTRRDVDHNEMPQAFFDALASTTSDDNKKMFLQNFLNSSWVQEQGYSIMEVGKYKPSINMVLDITQRSLPSKKAPDSKMIPINYDTQRHEEEFVTVPSLWLQNYNRANQMTATLSGNRLVILNKQHTGYYRVNYADWKSIADMSKENYMDLQKLARAQLFDDSYQLVKLKVLKTVRPFLQLTLHLQREIDSVPWVPAVRAFKDLWTALKNTPISKSLASYVLNLAKPLLNRIGYREKADDNAVDAYLRPQLIELVCEMGLETCESETLIQVIDHINGKRNISADLRDVVFRAGMRTANYTTWYSGLPLYTNGNYRNILSALGYSANPKTIKFYLSHVLNQNITFAPDSKLGLAILRSVYEAHGLDPILEYVMDIIENLKQNDATWSELYYSLASLGVTITKPDQWEKLAIFCSVNPTKSKGSYLCEYDEAQNYDGFAGLPDDTKDRLHKFFKLPEVKPLLSDDNETIDVTKNDSSDVTSNVSTPVRNSSSPEVSTTTTSKPPTTYTLVNDPTEEMLLTCDAKDKVAKPTVFGDNSCWSRASAAANCDYAKRAFESEFELFTKFMGPTDVSRRFIIIFAPPECVSEFQENNANTTSRRIVRIILPEGCESEKDKYNIAVAIYKELSLQWFDKLLTPESLENNGWLWRGLHTYFQHFVTNEINKPWAPEDLMIVRDLQSIAFPQELSVSAQSLSQSQGPFEKAQCIVRMIWHMMSSTEMLNGLWKFAQDAGTRRDVDHNEMPQAFFDALASTTSDDNKKMFLQNFLNSSWVQEQGYSIMEVGKYKPSTNMVLDITQRSLPSKEAPDSKMIPINYDTQRHEEEFVTVPSLWLQNYNRANQMTATLSGNRSVILNKQHTGYYRVNYADWESIADMSKENYMDLQKLARAQLFDDSYQLVKLKVLKTIRWFLQLTLHLQSEIDSAPWVPAVRAFKDLWTALKNTTISKSLASYVLNLAKPLLNRIGYREKADDNAVDAYLRPQLIELVCEMELETCESETLIQVIDHINGKRNISADLRDVVFRAGMRTANYTTWYSGLPLYTNGNYRNILSALGYSENPETIQFYLSHVLDQNITFAPDSKLGLTILRSVYEAHGLDPILKYVLDTIENLKQNDAIWSGLHNSLAYLGVTITKPDQWEKMAVFCSVNPTKSKGSYLCEYDEAQNYDGFAGLPDDTKDRLHKFFKSTSILSKSH